MPAGSRLCAAAALVLLATPMRAEVVNRIVATIDGEPVTAHELHRYAEDRGVQGFPAAERLETLITDKLLEMEVKAQGITVGDAEVDRYIEEVRSRNRLDEAQFAEALEIQGTSLEAYRRRVRREIERVQLVNREIRQRVNVSPEEIERYYEAHLDDYATSPQVTVRSIYLALDGDDPKTVARIQAKAEEIRGLARGGRSFEKLARQFSEGPGAEEGGLLGTFTRGQMDEEFEAAAFQLEAGEVSAPVRTAAGFHLLKVAERIPEGHRPLADVEDDIREALYEQALQERFDSWLSRDLRERHHVEVLD